MRLATLPIIEAPTTGPLYDFASAITGTAERVVRCLTETANKMAAAYCEETGEMPELAWLDTPAGIRVVVNRPMGPVPESLAPLIAPLAAEWRAAYAVKASDAQIRVEQSGLTFGVVVEPRR